jgi:hypothetical protein
MTARRIALLLLVAACGGGGAPKPAPPASEPPAAIEDASGCRPAYAEYELRWRIARGEELASFGDTFEPDVIEEIVAHEVETLPGLDELQKLRLMYALVEVFIPEAPWSVAFAAAEHAISKCGESARRPT